MDTLLRDLRFAARTLAKTPAFTVIAVLALALGIGVNTAIFSVVDAVMLRPLPYAFPERMVFLQENSASLEGMSVAFPNYLDWKAQNQVFEYVAARQSTSYNLTSSASDSSEPERVEGSNVTGNLFPLLGVSPVLGRTFTGAEDLPGAPRVVVLNYGFWQRRFDRDRNVLGKILNLDGQPYTIIGVMPQGFRFPLTHLKGELWTSLGRFAAEPNFERGNHPGIYCVARMKPAIVLEKARADMDTVAHRLEAQYPDTNKGHRVGVYFLHERIVRDIRPAMLIVTGAVWFVLLIACANVANLLLARAAGRHQEIAIRTALGAGRGQLIRQLLTESTLLSLAGGLLGFFFALWGVRLLVTVLPPNLPRLSTITVDARILLFTVALSLLTGLLFGVVPAWQVSRQGVSGVLKESSRSSGDIRRQRTRSGLMIAEIALSLVLLIGAGLMMKSFFKLSQTTPGFNAAGTVTMEIGLPTSKYKDPQQWTAFFSGVLEQVQAIPGVRSAGTIQPLPMGGGGWQTSFTYEGRQAPAGEEFILTDIARVSPDYFSAMGVPLRKGRAFTAMDRDGSAKVAIVDESLANLYFPGENPIGKKIRLPEGHGMDGHSEQIIWREVVGVVAHVKNYGIDNESRVEVFLPVLQSPQPFRVLVVRTDTGNPASVAGAVRNAVYRMDPNQPVYNVVTMEELVANSLTAKRVALLLLGIFAVAALALSAVGLYGVISYSVTQRTQEIGIRMALGASAGDVLGMVLRQGMTLVAAGVAAGLLTAFGLTRLMSKLLFGVSATDPVTMVAVSLVLAVVAVVASFIPARRATRVDPIVALRYE